MSKKETEDGEKRLRYMLRVVEFAEGEIGFHPLESGRFVRLKFPDSPAIHATTLEDCLEIALKLKGAEVHKAIQEAGYYDF